MAKKRSVFLFGAGATYSWGSPTTAELTNMVRKSGYYITDNETTITEFIFRKLTETGFKETQINFETIISVIEELIVYYSQHDPDTKTPSILSAIFDSKFENEILNFSITGGQGGHGYKLQIPRGVDYPYSKFAYHKQTPPQFFFQHLINHLLTEINTIISDYAYHTPGHSILKTSTEDSQLFGKWMKKHNQRNILRLYTLNYERIFKVLLEREGIQTFEGFDCGEYIDYSLNLRANVQRILSDFDTPVHYNLHGSAFWRVFDEDHQQLPNPEIALTCVPDLPVNNSPASVQIERGKTLLVTNIITGYQKAQKGMITPFKQMQSAFDRDCCFADKLYIIGYSFSDEHINESIKTAIRHNKELKIVIIDPSFIKNDMDLQFALRLFPFKGKSYFSPKKVKDNLYSYCDDSFEVHTVGFIDFLRASATHPLWDN